MCADPSTEGMSFRRPEAGRSTSVSAAAAVVGESLGRALTRRPRVPRTTKKCTEPVTLSSGFPTDLRRSDCHSESHQPPALRTRCMRDSRGAHRGRQAPSRATCRKLRYFLFASGRTAVEPACSRDRQKRKRAGSEDPATEFAEPGALSSTIPTSVPLPRTARRESFDLPAPRARRRRKSTTEDVSVQDPSRTKFLANCEPSRRRAARAACASPSH
jgi:hypothetical protein